MRWIIALTLVAACASSKALEEQVADVCLGYVGLTNAVFNAHALGKISDEKMQELRPIGLAVGEQCSAPETVNTTGALALLSQQIDRLIAARAEVL